MPDHWAKEFVEHLRTVHFTQIALCVGLLVLASFPSKSEIQVAHEQVSEILGVTNSWNGGLFEAEAFKDVKNYLINDNQVVAFVPTDRGSLQANFELVLESPLSSPIRPEFESPSWRIEQDVPAEFIPKYYDSTSEFLNVPPPASLKSFEQLWDALLVKGRIQLPRTPKECIATYPEGLKLLGSGVRSLSLGSMKCTIEPLNIAGAPADVKMRFEYDATNMSQLYRERQLSRQNFDFYFEARNLPQVISNVTLFVPVKDFIEIEFDGQKALIEQAGKWNEGYRLPFKDAFRELASVDEPFEDANISSAERILAAEEKRTGDVFETMGLKIPAEVALRFGVLLILCVQLYLWIHLREFATKSERDHGFDVAWIGVYFSKVGRFFRFVSILLFPAGSVLALTIWSLILSGDRLWGWLILIAANLVSILLNILLWRVLPEPIAHDLVSPAPKSAHNRA
jgi:hypothetical protein